MLTLVQQQLLPNTAARDHHRSQTRLPPTPGTKTARQARTPSLSTEGAKIRCGRTRKWRAWTWLARRDVKQNNLADSVVDSHLHVSAGDQVLRDTSSRRNYSQFTHYETAATHSRNTRSTQPQHTATAQDTFKFPNSDSRAFPRTCVFHFSPLLFELYD